MRSSTRPTASTPTRSTRTTRPRCTRSRSVNRSDLRLLVKTLKDATVVPDDAIQHSTDGLYAYTVNPDNKAEVHKVKVSQSIRSEASGEDAEGRHRGSGRCDPALDRRPLRLHGQPGQQGRGAQGQGQSIDRWPFGGR